MGKERPPEWRAADDGGYPDDVEIIAMTIRHGADYTKRYLNSLARLEAYEDELRSKAAQAEVLPLPPSERRP